MSRGNATCRKDGETTGEIWLNMAKFSQKDNQTFDIGMTFLHELQHCFFGLEDNGTPTVFNYGKYYGQFYGGTPGAAVERVNKYREELGFPIRCSYECNPHYGIYYEMIPFRTTNNRIIWL